ncbi:MAG: YgiT-type zinc finger protein [Acidithiobacillus ferrivorans]|nr:YgiT-type zinc finger protein [Acidithiobacillus ferrivorans]
MTGKRFCLQCDDGTELVYGYQDMLLALGAATEVLTPVSGWHCPVCGECELTRHSQAGSGCHHGKFAEHSAVPTESHDLARLAGLEPATVINTPATPSYPRPYAAQSWNARRSPPQCASGD